MSAHPRHPRRTPSALPRLLALLALLCGLAGPALTAPAAATVRTPAATSLPAPAAVGRADHDAGPADDAVGVRVTSVRPRVVRPDDELVVRARIRNGTDEALPSPRATLRIHRFLRSTRSSLQQWTDQGLYGIAGTPIGTAAGDGPLAPGDSLDVELRVPASALGLSPADAAWGPRGISVEAVAGGRREAIERTFVLWQPTDAPVSPTRVSVVVPMTAGPVDPTQVDPLGPGATAAPPEPGTGPGADQPTDPPAGTASAPTDPGPGDDGAGSVPPAVPASPVLRSLPSRDDVDRLDAVLEATADRPEVSWAVDPALLAGARAAGAGTPAGRWVDLLTDAAEDRDVVALPFLDPDLAGIVHGGGDGLAFEAYARSREAVDPVLDATARADLFWPADDVPDLATVALAARAGATTVVVGDDALATEPLTYTPTGRGTVPTGDGGALAALVPDAVLTAELRTPAGTTPAVAAQRILAETAVITGERPNDPRHVLLTAPRDWHPDPRVTRAQLDALASAPWVELADLSSLVRAEDPGLPRAALPDRQVSEDEITPAEIAALGAARSELAAFARIVPDPALLMAGVDDAILATVAVAWRTEPVQRSLVVDAVVADLAAQRSGVSVVPGSSLNLISETGRFPLGLRNDLDQEATVQVVVQPASPVLVVDGPQTVTIPAGSETQVRVPFHAVGSGDVQVAVTLVSPEGVALGPPQRLTVRVRADWENVGTAVVAGLLGLALVVGIVRTIRRGQTRRRGAGSTPVAEIARLPEEPS